MLNHIQVAVVDDNEEDRAQVIGSLPDGAAADFLEYEDGADFLGALEGESAIPALVFLDLRMASNDAGFLVLEALRSNEATKAMPVVMISSSESPDDILSAYRGGANVYVHKSEEPGEFSDVIRKLMEIWTTSGRLPPSLDA